MERKEAVAILMESPIYRRIDLPGRSAAVERLCRLVNEEEDTLRQYLDALEEAI